MTGSTRALLRHRPLRIAGGVWLALLFGGAMAVQRGTVLAALGAPLGMGGTGARVVLALIAALIAFVLGYALLTRASRGPAAARAEREVDPYVAPPVPPPPPAKDEAPEPTVEHDPEDDFLEEEVVFEEEEIAFEEEPAAPSDAPPELAADPEPALEPHPVPEPALTPAASLREAWMLQTGEELAPVEVFIDLPDDNLPARRDAETPAAFPTLDELEQRLVEAISRLEQVDPRRDTVDTPATQAEYAEEGPLLDESARQAVKDALARLEGFTADR